MLFYRIEFILMFAATLLFLRLVKSRRIQNWYLLIASYYFYAYWDWRFCGLLLFSTTLDYWIARALQNSNHNRTRALLLAASLSCNLGVLATFKYCNFFIDNLQYMLNPLGMNLRHLQIILPVGISFYTFQTMSYVIDNYRRKLEPCRHWTDYALYVSFFPQLVAGPIVRASELLPQILSDRRLSWDRMANGFRQFTLGMFKKVFIADNLALFVDHIFGNAGAFDCQTTWLAVIAYAIQIYCDFSGYSDMAIGIARMMGFDFSVNFNLPYLARNFTEFWHRWHISLSTWLRDYLYIPLGGNRKGKNRAHVNIMITMLLGGLWHGASWNFILWGFIHGLALITHKVYLAWLGKHKDSSKQTSLIEVFAGWTITMLVVLIGWVFFRTVDIKNALNILGQMFIPHGGIHHISPFPLMIVAGFILHHSVNKTKLSKWTGLDIRQWATPAALYIMILLTILYWPRGFHPFIYFQF